MPDAPQPTSPSTSTAAATGDRQDQTPPSTSPPDNTPDADGITPAMRAAHAGVDFRRPRCEVEKMYLARGYEIPHRRHVGLDVGNLDTMILNEPEPALEATGCPDPLTAKEFIERIGAAMPGTFHVSPPRNPNVKSRVDVYNRAAIHGAAIHGGKASTGVIAQNLVLAESWALHLLQIVGEIRGGPDPAQERAIRLATKFMDLVSRQAEVLDRLKNGTRQVVRVEKVVVEPGGQAVVGVVQPGQPRDGGQTT